MDVFEDENFKENFLQGKLLMDSIRVQVNKMIEIENQTLKKNNLNYDFQNKMTPIYTVVITFLTLILLIFSYFKINSDLRIYNLQTIN